jgi:hypothetical protein
MGTINHPRPQPVGEFPELGNWGMVIANGHVSECLLTWFGRDRESECLLCIWDVSEWSLMGLDPPVLRAPLPSPPQGKILFSGV